MLQRLMGAMTKDAKVGLVEDCALAIERMGWPGPLSLKRLADAAGRSVAAMRDAGVIELRVALRKALFLAPPLAVAELLRAVYLGPRRDVLDAFYTALGVTADADGTVDDAELARTADPSTFTAGVMRAAESIDRAELLMLLETIAAAGADQWRRVARETIDALDAGSLGRAVRRGDDDSPRGEDRSSIVARIAGEGRVNRGTATGEVSNSSVREGDLPSEVRGEFGTDDDAANGVDGEFDGPPIDRDPSPEDVFLASVSVAEKADVVNGAGGGARAEAGIDPAADRRVGSGSDDFVTEPTGFTPLDRLIVRTIVGTLDRLPARNEIDELESMIDEVVRLDHMRHRSSFHRGLLDALMGAPQRPRQRTEHDERRAWYLTGHVFGAGHLVGAAPRRTSPVSILHDPVLAALNAMAAADRDLLERGPSAGGAVLAPHALPRLLGAGHLEDAERWLRAHVDAVPGITADALAWIERHLVDGDPEACASLVRTCREALVRMAALRAGPTAESISSELRQLTARTHAIEGLVQRLRRNFAAAVRCYEAAIEQHDLAAGGSVEDSITDSRSASAAVGGLAMARLSIGDINEIRVSKSGDRQSQRDAIAGVAPLLERAASSRYPWPPALVLQAMPVVTDRRADDRAIAAAISALGRAAELMSESGRPIWSRSGLLERCRLYLAVAILRQLDPATAGPAAERVADRFREGVEAPDELWELALELASAAGAPAAIEIATGLFDRDPSGTLRFADLPRLASNPRFRTHLRRWLAGDEGAALTPSERARLLEAVLRSATAQTSRDHGFAEWAIGELDALAMVDSAVAERLLELLTDRTCWEGAIEEGDCIEIRVRHLDRLGRAAELGNLLQKQLHQAISAEQLALGRDLVEWLRELGLGEMAAPVSGRIETLELDLRTRREEIATDASPIVIGFIGGNEMQRQYEEELRRRLAKRVPNLTVWFEFPGWGSNWRAVADRVSANIAKADAVVLMPMVRTQLGRHVRRVASETATPWIPCTGRGCESLTRSLFHAIAVVQRQRSDRRRDDGHVG